MTDAQGQVITTTHESRYHAFPVQVSNDLGQMAQYDYDYRLGRVTQVTRPDNTTTSTVYQVDTWWAGMISDALQGGRGWQQEVTDARGNKKYYTHDAHGRLSWVGEKSDDGCASLYVTVYRYDLQSLDQLEKVTSGGKVCGTTYTAGTVESTMSYDELGRKTGMTDADMGAWSYDYDAVGDLTSQTDASQDTINFTYDSLNRLTTVDYPTDPDVGYSYDGGYSATLSAWSDRLINTYEGRTYVSIGNNQVEFTVTVPETGDHTLTVTVHQDSQAGNPGQWDSIVDVYLDSLSNLLGSINLAGGIGPAYEQYPTWYLGPARSGSFGVSGLTAGNHTVILKRRGDGSYNSWAETAADGNEIALDYGRGRRTGMTDGSGSTSWAYDARGRVTQERKTITGAGSFTTGYDYYRDDQVQTMTYPDGEGVTTAYNVMGLPESLSGSSTYVSGASYTAEGRLDVLSLGSNLQMDQDYYPWDQVNGLGRLQRIQGGTTTNPTSLQDLRYQYDGVGNVTRMEDWKAGSPEASDFGYDALDRLTGASGAYSESYAYNAIGNLTSKTGVGSYTYGASASGCSAGTPASKPHAVVQAGSYTFSYDCNGNVVQRNLGTSYSLTYDEANRLKSVIYGSNTADYDYDGDGTRVKRDDPNGTIVYVGNHYEKNTGSGVVTKYYYLGSKRIAVRVGNTLYYLFGDHLGSSSVSYRSDGGDTRTQRYYPWGTIRPGPGNALPTDYTFTGQKLDESTGLMYYEARYYDPALGRFISPDPIVPEPENPQDLNRYSYVRNNPLRYVDPTGHQPEWWQRVVQRWNDLVEWMRFQVYWRNPCNWMAYGCEVSPRLPQPPAPQSPSQEFLIGPEEVEQLREITQITNRAARLAQLTRFFQPELSASDELYTRESIATVESHLRDRLDAYDDFVAPYNPAMVARQRAIMRGELAATPYDINWMRHELIESALMDAEMSYEEAHKLANQLQGVAGDWDLWPTEIIEEYQDWLVGPAWRRPLQQR